MKSKKMLLAVFIAVAVVQAAVPLYMAWHWENILQTGQRFLWQTVPVDPYDAFRGRYIALRFAETSGPIGEDGITAGQAAYALIAEDAAGRAYISEICAQKPAAGDYVKVTAYPGSANTAQVVLPFSRYYLPENLAPAAEAAYRDHAGQSGTAVVRIKDGYGVVEQVYIGENTLREFLEQEPGVTGKIPGN